MTKRRILEAAADVFADKGYYAAAVDDIVRASDTSKGSFYHFFPSKQGIFLALVDHMYSVLLRRVEAAIEQERGALNKVDAALRTVLTEFSRHRRLAKIMLIEAAGLGHAFNDKLFELHAGFAQLIQRYLDRAVEEGSIKPLDTELAAYGVAGGRQRSGDPLGVRRTAGSVGRGVAGVAGHVAAQHRGSGGWIMTAVPMVVAQRDSLRRLEEEFAGAAAHALPSAGRFWSASPRRSSGSIR